MIPSLVFLWAFLSALTHAEVTKYSSYGQEGQTFYACAYSLARLATLCSKKGYSCYCTSEIGIATLSGCLAYDHHNTTSTFKYWIKYCDEYFTPLNMSQIEDGYQYYLESAVSASDIPGFNKSVPVTVPLKINEKNTKLYEEAYKVFLGNYDNSLYYGAGCLGYWALVILLAMVANWSVHLFPGIKRSFDGPISRAWRKYITLPALMRRKRSESQKFLFVLDFIVPSRIESITMILFFGLCVGCCAAEIYYVKNDPIFSSPRQAISRYVADRTGIMCTIITPLLVLLGGRNNFIQFLTRWKFSTVLVFHRWISRMMVMMAFIHAISYSWLFIYRGDYAEEMAENYLVWGVVAVSCGVLLTIQSLLFLRRRWYEVFLVVHILLAVFFIVGLWYHVWELGYAQFVYPCFAIWGFDRLVRVLRIAIFGTPEATVSLVAEETITVSIKKPNHWKAIPGGHAWIHFTGGYFFWQSHPFTFVSKEDGTLMFYCKVKGGATKSLARKLAKSPGKTLNMKILVEGPYGETKPLKAHSNLLFVAGGSGIPGIYCEAAHFAKRGADNNQSVKLVWIIRELKSLSWFWTELQALRETKTQTTIYVTQPDSVQGSNELFPLLSYNDSEKGDEKSLEFSLFEKIQAEMPHITFIGGRPNIENMVKAEIAESAHSVAVISCGHPAMVDEVRYNVVKQVDLSKKRVDFYDALEVWA